MFPIIVKSLAVLWHKREKQLRADWLEAFIPVFTHVPPLRVKGWGGETYPSMHLAEGRETPWTGYHAHGLTFVHEGSLESQVHPTCIFLGCWGLRMPTQTMWQRESKQSIKLRGRETKQSVSCSTDYQSCQSADTTGFLVPPHLPNQILPQNQHLQTGLMYITVWADVHYSKSVHTHKRMDWNMCSEDAESHNRARAHQLQPSRSAMKAVHGWVEMLKVPNQKTWAAHSYVNQSVVSISDDYDFFSG